MIPVTDAVLPPAEFAALAIGAVRYALGRRTYIVSRTCGIIRAHLDSLDANARDVVSRDIDEATSRHSLGDAPDAAEWGRLAVELRKRKAGGVP